MITHGAYNLTLNLDGTGDFRVQDSGVTRFEVNDAGLIGMGDIAITGNQLSIKPSSDSTRGILLRPNSSTQTAHLLCVQNASGTNIAWIDTLGFIESDQSVDQYSDYSIIGRQTAVIQQSNISGSIDEDITTRWIACKFTASSSYNIRSLSVYLKSSGTVSNPTATLNATVYSDNAGVPGVRFATSSPTSIRIGSVGTSYSYQFFYTGNTTLVAETDYWTVVNLSALPVGATLSLRRNSVGASSFSTSSDGVSWTNEDNKGLIFRLHGRTYHAILGSSYDNAGVYGASLTSYGGYFTST